MGTLITKPEHTQIKFFSGLRTTEGVKLPAWFITGFADAESSFTVTLTKGSALTGVLCRIHASFQIKVHIKDADLLNKIQVYFGVGNVTMI